MALPIWPYIVLLVSHCCTTDGGNVGGSDGFPVGASVGSDVGGIVGETDTIKGA